LRTKHIASKLIRKPKNRSPELISFDEISISTGKEHGAFYRPISEWVVPVKQWVKEKNSYKSLKQDKNS
jgi:hypothetical protein